MFRRCLFGRIYVQKVLCSEDPIGLISSSYVQKVFFVQKVLVQKILCPEGLMLRSSYIQKLLFSEWPILKKEKQHKKRHKKRRKMWRKKHSKRRARRGTRNKSKQRCIGVGYVKQDAAQDAAPPSTRDTRE